MSRKRLLPKYVSSFRDRHGKDRLRFRRLGYPTHYFKSLFGTEAFRTEYRQCLDSATPANPPVRPDIEPGSIADLVSRYLALPTRLGPTPSTQAKIRAIILKFQEGCETWPVNGITFEHIDAIVAKKRVKVKVSKANGRTRTEGGVEAARKLRKELVRMFDYAKKRKMIPDNPVREAEFVRAGPTERTKGYHTWEEVEIEQYRARWPVGTTQRLAMELMLWTGQRRGDAIRFGPADVKDGWLSLVQDKTGKPLKIPVAPALVDAIVAMPHGRTGKTFLLTGAGKPFTNAGFGNWFRDQCNEAGLPQCSAHGLRKATMRRMAELLIPNQPMKAVSGHTKDDEVAVYTAQANQKRLAQHAIAKIAAWEKATPEERLAMEGVVND